MKLKVYGDNSQLWQWDTGQKLIVEDDGTCNEVHFCNTRAGETALVVPIKEQDGLRLVDVPNILLQKAAPLTAFLYHYDADGSETRYSYHLPVRGRPKPESYVYTETDVLNYAYLDERLRDLEGNGLANAVADYLKENPVQAGATAEEAAQIKKNKEDIEKLVTDMVDNDQLLNAVNNALEDYMKDHPVTGGSDSALLVVTFTTDESGKHTPSHTFTQIKEWLNNGGSAVLTDGKVWYNLATVSASVIRFERTVITASGTLYASYVIPMFGDMDEVSSKYEHSGGSGGLIITDDENGNVTIESTGSVTITDDGFGNVTIA